MSGEEEREIRQINWDTEERHELEEAEGRLRGTTMFIAMALLAWMVKEFGNFTHLRTATDKETGDVIVAKADKKTKGAVPVRRTV